MFKAVTGVNAIPADLWFASFSTNEDEQKALNPSSNFIQNYKNRVILKWHVFAPSEVGVPLYFEPSYSLNFFRLHFLKFL